MANAAFQSNNHVIHAECNEGLILRDLAKTIAVGVAVSITASIRQDPETYSRAVFSLNGTTKEGKNKAPGWGLDRC